MKHISKLTLPTITLMMFILTCNIISITAASQSFIKDNANENGSLSDQNPQGTQRLIMITPPFKYLPIDLSYDFKPYFEGLLYNDHAEKGNPLNFQGDFGYFMYDNKIFNIFEIKFKSPSEHTFGNHNIAYPLEMQILSINSNGFHVNMAILFKEAKADNTFLAKFGFGKGILEYLANKKLNKTDEYIDLNKILSMNRKSYFIYKEKMITQAKSHDVPTLWLVNMDIYEVSSKQLNDIPKKDMKKQVQNYKINGFIGFDSSLSSSLITASFINEFLNLVEHEVEQISQNVHENEQSNGLYDRVELEIFNDADDQDLQQTFFNNIGNPSINGSRQEQQQLSENLFKKPGNLRVLSQIDERSNENEDIANRHKTNINNQIQNLKENEASSYNDILFLQKRGKDLKNQVNSPSFLIKISPNEAKLIISSPDNSSLLKNTRPSESLLSGLREATRIPDHNTEDSHNETLSPPPEPLLVLYPESKEIIAERIYNILRPNIEENGIDKGYILMNLDQILDEYQILMENKQKGNTPGQLSELDKNGESILKRLLKGKSSDVYKDFGEKLKMILMDVIEKQNSSMKELFAKENDIGNKDKTSPIENPKNPQSPTQKSKSPLSSISPTEQTTYDITIANQILLQSLGETESEETESENLDSEDILGPLPATANPDEKILKPVIGPMVTNKIRAMFDVQEGRGSLAFSKEGVWDGINIWQTIIWPSTCKYGTFQSPVHVNVNDNFEIEYSGLTFNYSPSITDAIMSNDGYKLILTGDFGSVKYGDHLFYADEIYIHHPSEHIFGDNSTRADFEIQILHSDSFDLKIAISVFLKNINNQQNQFLAKIGFNDPQRLLSGDQTTLSDVSINLKELVEGATEFIEYEGSLTTPPCSEGIKWFLLNQRLPVNNAQIQAFKQIFGKDTNVRGHQPMNTRSFYVFTS